MTGSLKLVDPGGPGELPTWESVVQQKRKRGDFRTRKEAEAWHALRVAAALAGTLEGTRERKAREKRESAMREDAERAARDAEKLGSVSGLLDEWFAIHKLGLAGGTAHRYEGLIRNLKPVLPKGVSVVEFTRRDGVKVFADFAARGGVNGGPQGGSSTKQARVVLTGAFDKAVDDEVIAANPLRGMRRLSLPPSAERQPPSMDDVRRLLAAAAALGDLDMQVAIGLGSGGGMRRGEMLALEWSAVDLAAGMLEVRQSLEEVGATVRIKVPKTARSRRTIALPTSVVDVLRQHRRRQREWALQCGPGYDRAADLVLPGPDGKPRRPSSFSDAYLAFAKSVGVRGSLHDLRHFHASALIAGGVDPRSVANRLGHSSPSFTMSRYVHAGSDADRKAASSFDDLLRGPGVTEANEAAS